MFIEIENLWESIIIEDKAFLLPYIGWQQYYLLFLQVWKQALNKSSVISDQYPHTL
jgi:hypothetical protein